MHRYDVAILRSTAVPTFVAGVVLVVASAALAGPRGALGAASGVAVVAVFFTISLVAVAWASRISPFVMMQVAIFSYLVKIVLLGVLVAALANSDVFNTRAFALAVLVSTLVWIGAQMRAFMKLKMLYVEPAGGEARPPSAGRPDNVSPE